MRHRIILARLSTAFPIDMLEIDRSFVERLEGEGDAGAGVGNVSPQAEYSATGRFRGLAE